MGDVDVTSALRYAENALRDVIKESLLQAFNEQWQDHLGITEERKNKWKERKVEDQKRLSNGGTESRLLYFADFTDLKTILFKNWEIFKAVFNDKKELEVFLSKLEDLRNPDAHRRGFSEYQEHLALGISGELRTQIARYRSRCETAKDCFPRIEAAFDNYGRAYPEVDPTMEPIPTLRVGDRIEIAVNAVDPDDMPVDYHFSCGGCKASSKQDWGENNRFSLELTGDHISKRLALICRVRSRRAYHANEYDNGVDDAIVFTYEVLPTKIKV